MRLDKYLSNNGEGSRKDVAGLIRTGAVSINGVTVKDRAKHIEPDSDVVEVNGKILTHQPLIYIMLNKPAGIVSATEDTKFQTVIDLVPEKWRHYRLFPAGRLDRDTEGLVILTNDGDFAHEILSPKKHIPKKYYAEVKGELSEDTVKLFKGGISIDGGYVTLPSELEIIDNKDGMTCVNLTIFEGKFHQVKRMFEAVDAKVKYLKRVKMGNLSLPNDLQIGSMIEFNKDDII